jgi:exopolysaccharide production protein ExoY
MSTILGHFLKKTAPCQEGNLATPRLHPEKISIFSPCIQTHFALGHLVDLILSTLLLIFFGPLMLIITMLVWLEGGSPIYNHPRVGKSHKNFMCFKFRTMCRDGDEVLMRHLSANPAAADEWLRTRKLKCDPRVTPIGRFLRKHSLDELPQLLNVLRGEMSLVGPRPITSEEIGNYGDYVEYYLSVRPGMTGLWQVSGRSNLDFNQRVQMDVQYVEAKNVVLDISIMIRTISVVIFGVGAS